MWIRLSYFVLFLKFGQVVSESEPVAKANKDEFPFVVILGNKFDDNYICQGTVIRSNWILTTASCVDDKNAHDIYAKYGPYLFQYASLSEIFIHPNYENDYKKYKNNIALVKAPVQNMFEDLNKFAEIPPKNYEFSEGNLGFVYSWLENITHFGHQKDLAAFEVYIRSKTDYGSRSTHKIIVAESANSKFICKDDIIGAPLIVNGYQIGIYSESYLCPHMNMQNYTDVTLYLDWIIDTTDLVKIANPKYDTAYTPYLILLEIIAWTTLFFSCCFAFSRANYKYVPNRPYIVKT